MSPRSTKGKGAATTPVMTVAKLRRLGAFKGGASVEERLRLELKAAEFSVECLLPLARMSDKSRKAHAEANAKRKEDANTEHARWQEQAVALWAQPQHADKNASDIARLIDLKHWNTVRHFISNPKK